MADKAISELVEAQQVTATDLFVLQQDNTAKKLSGQTLINYLLRMIDGHGGITNYEKVSTSGLKDNYRFTFADQSTYDLVVTNGRAISSVSETSDSGLTHTYTIAFNDGTNQTFTVTDGKAITSVKQTSVSGLTRTYTIAFNDGTSQTFTVTDGRSITETQKTSTNGLVDTYTIAFNDGSTSTFTVTNGAKGDQGDNTYLWIKYASQEPTASSHSIGNLPDNWIGIYYGALSEAPTDWKQYTWFKIKGEKGDTGDPATLVSAAVTYQVGDSGTIIPSGAWGTSIPVVPQGKYLWTREVTQFNTGDPITKYSVARFGIDGAGSVSSVCNIPPDENGNVPLSAENVGALPTAGGDMLGPINMNGQTLSGLNAPITNDQAANKGYVDGAVKKAAPRNLLDNSDFTNPVNQRGQVAWSITGYTIDRWRLENRGDNGAGLSDAGFTLHSSTTTILLYQVIDEDIRNYLMGKTVTIVAVDSDGNRYFDTGIVPEIFEGSTSIADAKIGTTGIKVDMYYSSSSDKFRFRIWGNQSAHDVTIANVALYEGEYTAETLPEYQPKGYGAELAECQRYLLYGILMGIPTNRWGEFIGFFIPTPVTMRNVNPSVVGTFTVHTTVSPSDAVNCTLINTVVYSNGVYVYLQFNSSADAGKVCSLEFDAGSGLSSDL